MFDLRVAAFENVLLQSITWLNLRLLLLHRKEKHMKFYLMFKCKLSGKCNASYSFKKE